MDLKTLVARMRALGASPALLRAAALERVGQLLLARRAEVASHLVPEPYWGRRFGQVNPKVTAEINALNKEQEAMLKEALGPDAAYPVDDPVAKAMMNLQNPGISSAAFERVQKIQQDYNELRSEVWSANRGVTFPEDGAKLAYLESEMQADLAKAMTPEEFFEYQLRNSNTAGVLRNQLRAFSPTEDEFREIFKAQQDFDQKYGSPYGMLSPDQQAERTAHQADLLAAVQAALEPDRFADYKLETDGNYLATDNVVQRLGLPPATTQQVSSIRTDIRGRAAVIEQDDTLSAADKTTQLAGLYDEATLRITAILGEKGLAAYQTSGGWWIQGLKHKN